MSPEKAGLLKAFLGSLPERAAARLAQAVEADRSMGGTALPHSLILDALRLPSKRAAAQMPLRLFCEPFEDLLTDEPRREKRKGRIARSSIAPVWAWLSQTLMPGAVRAYAEKIVAANAEGAHDAGLQIAKQFQAEASQTIRNAVASDRKIAVQQLAGDLVVADAEEMALLLSAGAQIADLQYKLPCHTPQLSEDAVWTLRTIYDGLAQSVPDVAPYVAVIAMGRLDRPWEALRLPLQISRQTSDTLISSTDIGLAGEVLLGDLDVHAAAIRVARHPVFDPVVLAAHVAAFARLSNGLSQEIDLRRDGNWSLRLMKDRKAVSDAMDALMERAPREILAAMPVAKTGSYGGGPKAPDIARAPDAEKTERGLRYAKLVVAVRDSAAGASFGARQKDAYNEACAHLENYSDGIVQEVRASEGAKRVIAEQYFAIAADFTAILFSQEEAETLRRRGRAAMADAA